MFQKANTVVILSSKLIVNNHNNGIVSNISCSASHIFLIDPKMLTLRSINKSMCDKKLRIRHLLFSVEFSMWRGLQAFFSTVHLHDWLLDRSCHIRIFSWQVSMAFIVNRSYLIGGHPSFPCSFVFVILIHFNDSIGRKKSWMLSMVLLSSFGVAASFTPEYWSHVFLRFVSGMAAAGLFGSGFILGKYI